jgi:hypothetical protein
MTEDLAALPFTEHEIGALRRGHVPGTGHSDLTWCDEFCHDARWLATLAALSRPAPAPSLDVEQLARVIGSHLTYEAFVDLDDREMAELLATEYARLSAEEPQP